MLRPGKPTGRGRLTRWMWQRPGGDRLCHIHPPGAARLPRGYCSVMKMLPLPLVAVITWEEDGSESGAVTLPLSVWATMSYFVVLAGSSSVMLPLSVLTRTFSGTLVNAILMLPSPVEAVIVAVVMPDPSMLPLSVLAAIVVDVTPVAPMLPSPDESKRLTGLAADPVVLTRMLPLSAFRVSGPEA